MLTLLTQGAAGGAARSVVVLDSKPAPDEWISWGPRHGFTVGATPADISRFPRVVHQVDQLTLEDRAGWARPGRPGYAWTEALDRVYRRGNTIVLFNEGLNTLPVSGTHPRARRLLQQGRALGLSVWVESQRPRWLDPFALKLAEHVFSFAMPDADDRQYMRAQRGLDCEVLAQLEGHEFAYHRQGLPSWEWCGPVPFSQRGNARVAAPPAIPATRPDDLRDASLRDENDPAIVAGQ